jgi:DNA modification methylase
MGRPSDGSTPGILRAVTDGNVLYYGDNLDVLRRHVANESVDLIYLDPPFNSNVDYNVLFEEHGTGAAAQIRAFDDTWEWNEDSARAFQETVEMGGDVANALVSFRTLLGGSDMLAYLAMMAPRLVELRRVLKDTGSIYLHCDPTASHYLKLLLDATFGPKNFMAEIVWFYRRWTAKANNYQHSHDVILFYAKDKAKVRCHPPEIPSRAAEAGRDGRGWNSNTFVGPDGKRLRQLLITNKALYEIAVKEGRVNPKDWDRVVDMSDRKTVAAPDVFEIPIINPMSKERLGYPTQKPLALLERIIAASSDPDDVVLDPFCGCGTALDAAQAMKRRWIGIDITHLAIGLIRSRLVGRYGPSVADTFKVIGEPVSLDDARVLAREDPFQFQAWALGLVGGRPTEVKKGGDEGVDGRLYFHDEGPGGQTKQIILSVKAGGLDPSHVRDLIGTVNNQGAELGVLLSFEKPTDGMRKTAANAGFYDSAWGKHPRIQLITVGELLDGKRIDYPPTNVTYRQAEPAGPAEAESYPMFDEEV